MSLSGLDTEFLFALRTNGKKRNQRELNVIYARLYHLETLSSFKEKQLRALCSVVRYESHDANEILYRKDDPSRCWYVLMSGSVFIQGSMFLPYACFGKQFPGTKRRGCQCLVLEPSEMIAIDYPDMALHTGNITTRPHAIRNSIINSGSQSTLDSVAEADNSSSEGSPSRQSRSNSLYKTNNGQALMMADNESQSSFSKDMDEDDYPEQDLDEDDSISLHSTSSIYIKDLVIEVLKKEIDDRNTDDLEILLEFTKSLRAFSNMTEPTRRALCKVMVFAWVANANTIVLKENEQLDSWSVIINGQVLVKNGDKETMLMMGDSFGVQPTLQAQNHKGVMTTVCDDCQFLCIAQDEYFDVLHQGQENIQNICNESGAIVMVKERREFDNGTKKGNIVIRGDADSLLNHLLEENAIDTTYTEDFLLTYRAFANEPLKICNKLLEWFDQLMFRDKVTRIILLWVNNHFNDFECDWRMMALLEKFEEKLNKYNLQGETKLFNIACTAKAKPRVVSISRMSCDVGLGFDIMGGSEHQFPLYISTVIEGSLAERKGIKRGDQLLEVNGQNFEKLSFEKAHAILKKNTDLALTLKTNLFAFKEMLAELQNPDGNQKKSSEKPAQTQRPPRVANTLSAVPEPENFDGKPKKELPEDIIKIYKADQTFRFIFVSRDTTAGEAVQSACKEFGITDDVGNYSLYKVSVQGEKFVKQSKLPDLLSKLPDIPLGARYYLKQPLNSEQLLPDENIPELLKEANFSFLDLNCFEVALYLTREDYRLFQQTEPTNFVDDLFHLQSNLQEFKQFEDLVNSELFWVVTTICEEPNVIQRSKIIKQFIKIAQHCKILKNFNSTFALISGLGYRAVSRMKQSWEKVPAKSTRQFEELQGLMDPSRNMSKYRTLLNEYIDQPPVIPYVPVVKKDLTFLHLGNDTKVENLINFEKMRMIAKEVRNICRLCAPDMGQIIPSAAAAQQKDEKGPIYQTLARRGRRASFNNARRMYEDRMNVRRVRQYMKQINIITDEDELNELSKMTEGGSGTGLPKRRHTSAAISSESPSRTSKTLPSHGRGSNSVSSGSLTSRNNSEPHLPNAPTMNTAGTKKKIPSSTLPKYSIGPHSPQMISRKLMSLSEESGGDSKSKEKKGKESKRSVSVSSHDYSPSSSPFLSPKHHHPAKPPTSESNHTIGMENTNRNNNRHSLPAGAVSIPDPPSPGRNIAASNKKFFPISGGSGPSSCRSSIASASSLGTVSSSNPSTSSLGGNNSPCSSSPVPWGSSGSLSNSSTSSPRLLHSQVKASSSPVRSSSGSSADTVVSTGHRHSHHERPIIKQTQTRNGRSSSFGGGSMVLTTGGDRRFSQMSASNSSPTLNANGPQASLILPNHPQIPRTPSIDSGVVSAGSLSADSTRFNLADENEIFARSLPHQNHPQHHRHHQARGAENHDNARRSHPTYDRPSANHAQPPPPPPAPPANRERNENNEQEKVEQTFLSGFRGQGDPPRLENKDPFSGNMPQSTANVLVGHGKFAGESVLPPGHPPTVGYPASQMAARNMMGKSGVKGIHEFLVCERHSHYYRASANSNNNNSNYSPVMQSHHMSVPPDATVEEQLVLELQKQRLSGQTPKRRSTPAYEIPLNIVGHKEQSFGPLGPPVNNLPDWVGRVNHVEAVNSGITATPLTSSPKAHLHPQKAFEQAPCVPSAGDKVFNNPATRPIVCTPGQSPNQYGSGIPSHFPSNKYQASPLTTGVPIQNSTSNLSGSNRPKSLSLSERAIVHVKSSSWGHESLEHLQSKSLNQSDLSQRTHTSTPPLPFADQHTYQQQKNSMLNGIGHQTNGIVEDPYHRVPCDVADGKSSQTHEAASLQYIGPHASACPQNRHSPAVDIPAGYVLVQQTHYQQVQQTTEVRKQARRKTSQEWNETNLDDEKQQATKGWEYSPSLISTPLSSKTPSSNQTLSPRNFQSHHLRGDSDPTSAVSKERPPAPAPPKRKSSIGRPQQLRLSSASSPSPPHSPPHGFDGCSYGNDSTSVNHDPVFRGESAGNHVLHQHKAVFSPELASEQSNNYDRRSLPTYTEAVHQISSNQSSLFSNSYRSFSMDARESQEQVSQV